MATWQKVDPNVGFIIYTLLIHSPIRLVLTLITTLAFCRRLVWVFLQTDNHFHSRALNTNLMPQTFHEACVSKQATQIITTLPGQEQPSRDTKMAGVACSPKHFTMFRNNNRRAASLVLRSY